ncbi:MAG: hypothetical protein Q8S53_12210 [Brevundimonas sp.]|uniref:hypothetical protein n=1 Tax=Brevundimonas sp. TaxID=1871086 RepID=UPI002732DB96|nr:hypothetical protein [Brevundimonas sp.]MDP3379118.1 hypothetical protein [Brevundimonas sp.]
MAIDEKLFRIYQEADKKQHTRVADVAKAIAGQQLEEFSYQRRGERLYHTWTTVAEYVRLLMRFGLIGEDCQPLINAPKVSKQGFMITLGDYVERWADEQGFSAERIKEAARELLRREPARLPTPLNVHGVLQLQVSSAHFSKALSVRAYQDRIKVHPKQRVVLIIPDVIYE